MLPARGVLNSPLEEYPKGEVDAFSTPAKKPPLKRGI